MKQLAAWVVLVLPALAKQRNPPNVILGLDPRIQAGEMKVYYVYILASKRNGTIYIGVTNDVERRSYEHKIEALEGIKLIEKYNPEWVDLTETFLDSRVQPENDKDMV